MRFYVPVWFTVGGEGRCSKRTASFCGMRYCHPRNRVGFATLVPLCLFGRGKVWGRFGWGAVHAAYSATGAEVGPGEGREKKKMALLS